MYKHDFFFIIIISLCDIWNVQWTKASFQGSIYSHFQIHLNESRSKLQWSWRSSSLVWKILTWNNWTLPKYFPFLFFCCLSLANIFILWRRQHWCRVNQRGTNFAHNNLVKLPVMWLALLPGVSWWLDSSCFPNGQKLIVIINILSWM